MLTLCSKHFGTRASLISPVISPACAKYLELSLWCLPPPEKNITRLLYCQQVTKAKAHGRESDTHINRTPLSKTTRTETEYFLFSFLYVHGNVAYSYQVWIHGINRCLQFSCSPIRLCETGLERYPCVISVNFMLKGAIFMKQVFIWVWCQEKLTETSCWPT